MLNVYELSFSETLLSNVICKIPSGIPYGYCLWHVCTFIQIFLKNFQWESALSKLLKCAQLCEGTDTVHKAFFLLYRYSKTYWVWLAHDHNLKPT